MALSFYTTNTITGVTSAVSDRLNGRYATAMSFDFDWTGITATIGLQVSNKLEPVEADWKTVTGLTTSWTTQPAGTTSGVCYTLNGLTFRWIRVILTGVSGTGTLIICPFVSEEG